MVAVVHHHENVDRFIPFLGRGVALVMMMRITRTRRRVGYDLLTIVS